MPRQANLIKSYCGVFTRGRKIVLERCIFAAQSNSDSAKEGQKDL